jgi:predicted CoA-binding protein
VIPVNPNEAEVLQEKSYPNLLEINEAVDIVDVFRKPEFVPEIARQAVRIGAKALWLQLGVENEEAAALAAANGLAVIQDRCIMVEHLRLMGQATAGGHR